MFKNGKKSSFLFSLVISFLCLSASGGAVFAEITDLKKDIQKPGITKDIGAPASAGTSGENAASASPAGRAASEQLSSGVASVKNGAERIGQGLKGLFAGLFDVFKSFFAGLGDIFRSIAAAFDRNFNDGGNDARSAVDGIYRSVSEGVSPAPASLAASDTELVPASAVGSATEGTVVDEDPNGLNVRTAPWGDVAATLPKGAKVQILEKNGEWYKISHDGKEAYVYSSLIAANGVVKEGAAPAAPASPARTAEEAPAASSDPAKPDTSVSTPYFNQYDNSISPGSSCQNTSIAMVLAKYGWNGRPDDVTGRFGKDLAQSPAGLQQVFNSMASSSGLGVRLKAHTNGSMDQINSLLAQGKPVIVNGWFTSSGHVVTITGFDGKNYIVNDPAGKWNQQFKGGYSGGSGQGVKYSKEALQDAIGPDGDIWCYETYSI